MEDYTSIKYIIYDRKLAPIYGKVQNQRQMHSFAVRPGDEFR